MVERKKEKTFLFFEGLQSFDNLSDQPCENLVDAYNYFEALIYHISEQRDNYNTKDEAYYRLKFLFLEKIFSLLANSNVGRHYHKVFLLPYLLHYTDTSSDEDVEEEFELTEYLCTKTKKSHGGYYQHFSVPKTTHKVYNSYEIGQVMIQIMNHLENDDDDAPWIFDNQQLFAFVQRQNQIFSSGKFKYSWYFGAPDMPNSLLVYNLFVYQLKHPESLVTSNNQVAVEADEFFYKTNRIGNELPMMEDYFDMEKHNPTNFFFISNNMNEPDKQDLLHHFSKIYPKSLEFNLLTRRLFTLDEIQGSAFKSDLMSRKADHQRFVIDFISMCAFVYEGMTQLNLRLHAIVKYCEGMLGVGTGMTNYPGEIETKNTSLSVFFYEKYCQIINQSKQQKEKAPIPLALREFITAVYNIYVEGFFLWQGNSHHEYDSSVFQLTYEDFHAYRHHEGWVYDFEKDDKFVFIVMETILPETCRFSPNELLIKDDEQDMNDFLQEILKETTLVECQPTSRPYTQMFSMRPNPETGAYQLDTFNIKLRLFPILIIDSLFTWIVIPPVYKQEYLLPFTQESLSQQHESQGRCFRINNRRIVSNKQMVNTAMRDLSYQDLTQEEISCTDHLLRNDSLIHLSNALVDGFQTYYESRGIDLPKGFYPMTIDVLVKDQKIYLLDVNFGGNYGVHGPAISLLLMTDFYTLQVAEQGMIEVTTEIYAKTWHTIIYTKKPKLRPQEIKRKRPRQQIQKSEQEQTSEEEQPKKKHPSSEKELLISQTRSQAHDLLLTTTTTRTGKKGLWSSKSSTDGTTTTTKTRTTERSTDETT